MPSAYKLNIIDITDNLYVKSDSSYGTNFVDIKGVLKVSKVRILAKVTFKFISDDKNYASITLDDGTGNLRVKIWQDIKILDGVENDDLIDILAQVREWNGDVYLVPEALRIVDDPELKTLRRLEILKFKRDIGLLDREAIAKEITNPKTDTLIVKPINTESKKIPVDTDSKKLDVDKKTSEKNSELILDNSKSEIEKTKKQEMSSEKRSDGTEETRPLRVRILEIIEKLDDGEGADIDEVFDGVKVPTKESDAVINELLSEGTCYEPRAGRIKVL